MLGGEENSKMKFPASPNRKRIYHGRCPVTPKRARGFKPHSWRRVGLARHGHADAAAELVVHDMHWRGYADNAHLAK